MIPIDNKNINVKLVNAKTESILWDEQYRFFDEQLLPRPSRRAGAPLFALERPAGRVFFFRAGDGARHRCAWRLAKRSPTSLRQRSTIWGG